MQVYRAHRANRVHFDPDCPRATGRETKVDLAELKSTRFCMTCSPEQLHHRPATRHVLCKVCRQARPTPCAHNGGVRVVNVDQMTVGGVQKRRVNTRWRWPENVQGAVVAQPILAPPLDED